MQGLHMVGPSQESLTHFHHDGNVSQQMLIMRGDEDSESEHQKNIEGQDRSIRALSRGSGSTRGSGSKQVILPPYTISRAGKAPLRDNSEQMPNSNQIAIANCENGERGRYQPTRTSEAFHESDDVMTLCAPQRPPLAPE